MKMNLKWFAVLAMTTMLSACTITFGPPRTGDPAPNPASAPAAAVKPAPEPPKTPTPTTSVLLPNADGNGWTLVANTAKHTNFRNYGAPGNLSGQRTVERGTHGVYDLTPADRNANRDRGNFERPASWTRGRFSSEWALPANSPDNVGVGALKNDKEHSYVLFGLWYEPNNPDAMAKFNALVTESGLDPANEAAKIAAALAARAAATAQPAQPAQPANPPSGGGGNP